MTDHHPENKHPFFNDLDKLVGPIRGPGKLGMIFACAGEGKSACLTQLCLNALLRGKHVLHIALGQRVEHVQSLYDSLIAPLARQEDSPHQETIYAQVAGNRLIHASSDHQLSADWIAQILHSVRDRLHFQPTIIAVDGFFWPGLTAHETMDKLRDLRDFTLKKRTELWMTSRCLPVSNTATHKIVPDPFHMGCDYIDIALIIVPTGSISKVKLIKGNIEGYPQEIPMRFNNGLIQSLRELQDIKPGHYKDAQGEFTLLSGGAEGSEAEFGFCAEKWGIQERTFSYSGRNPRRTQGLIELNEADLARGAVRPAFFQRKMQRSFPDTPEFVKTLQTIWHQVNTAGEIFAVGEIQSNQTIKGGTGWAVELARHFHKPVHVFDQKKHRWFSWSGKAWEPEETPQITSLRFCGTGTRHLSLEGKKAIHCLFEQSFGAVKS